MGLAPPVVERAVPPTGGPQGVDPDPVRKMVFSELARQELPQDPFGRRGVDIALGAGERQKGDGVVEAVGPRGGDDGEIPRHDLARQRRQHLLTRIGPPPPAGMDGPRVRPFSADPHEQRRKVQGFLRIPPGHAHGEGPEVFDGGDPPVPEIRGPPGEARRGEDPGGGKPLSPGGEQGASADGGGPLQVPGPRIFEARAADHRLPGDGLHGKGRFPEPEIADLGKINGVPAEALPDRFRDPQRLYGMGRQQLRPLRGPAALYMNEGGAGHQGGGQEERLGLQKMEAGGRDSASDPQAQGQGAVP